MAGSRSAGVLLYRRGSAALQVLLAHLGGPFWSGKDEHAWSVPKGEYADGDDPFAAARREFAEELGSQPPDGSRYLDLGEVRQSGGKVVHVWAVEGEFDPAVSVSNTFEIEWPPRSGRRQAFPEVDRVEWFDLATARTKLVSAQAAFLDRLADAVDRAG
jgi:predicted NUDIX family NTP pyrophosphohydrolase